MNDGDIDIGTFTFGPPLDLTPQPIITLSIGEGDKAIKMEFDMPWIQKFRKMIDDGELEGAFGVTINGIELPEISAEQIAKLRSLVLSVVP